MMRMDDKMVQILGTLYAVRFDVPEEKMPEGADGCMDQSTHMIKIAKIEASRESLQNLDSYKKKSFKTRNSTCIFLYESGLWNNSGDIRSWGQSEEIADWIAIQSPKIFRAFKDVDAL